MSLAFAQEDTLTRILCEQNQKRAVVQCRGDLKSLKLPSYAEDVANRLQTVLDAIEPTFKTIIEMEERKDKVAQTPSKGKGRRALPLGVKSTPSKTSLRKMSSQRLVEGSPLKRPREESVEFEEKVLPTPKRVRVDPSIGSQFSVVEESDIGDAPPSSEAEVESIVRYPAFGNGRGNAPTITDLPDEDAEGDEGMDAMEMDEPFRPSKRQVPSQLEEDVEDVEKMDWPTLAAYRKRLIAARSTGRDRTELSRPRWRPVFADREYWGVVAVAVAVAV
jgi:hypothetical protein